MSFPLTLFVCGGAIAPPLCHCSQSPEAPVPTMGDLWVQIFASSGFFSPFPHIPPSFLLHIPTACWLCKASHCMPRCCCAIQPLCPAPQALPSHWVLNQYANPKFCKMLSGFQLAQASGVKAGWEKLLDNLARSCRSNSSTSGVRL